MKTNSEKRFTKMTFKHITFKWGFNFIQTKLNYSESKFIPVYNPQNINDKNSSQSN